MAQKRSRDEESVGWGSYTKQGRVVQQAPVNSIQILMQAARSLGTKGAGEGAGTGTSTLQQQGHPLPSQTVPCTHCGRLFPEPQLLQCSQCLDVYCSMCSVPNYDQHEDRVFCLECNLHQQDFGDRRAGYGHSLPGPGTLAGAPAAPIGNPSPWPAAASTPFPASGGQPHVSRTPGSLALRSPLALAFTSPTAGAPACAALSHSPWGATHTPSGMAHLL